MALSESIRREDIGASLPLHEVTETDDAAQWPVRVAATTIDTSRGLLAAQPWQLVVKRAFDIMATSLLLLALIPLLLLTAIAVKLSSPGPVFYRQPRVGRDGVPFSFWKFRTMREDADQVRAQLESRNQHEGPIFKVVDDPRITSVGRILRKLSIDEAPQLFHVLSGKMSLVGPRPPLATEVVEYDDWEVQRLLVKPGMTCIWQVSGRSDIDWPTWVSMDLDYIQNWSLVGDLSLLVRTVPAVLTGRGAY